MPESDNRMKHRSRNRLCASDKHNGRRDHGDWSRRMHHHANGAMIGIRSHRVDVRNLDERDQGQQQHADKRSGAQSPGLAVAYSLPSMLCAGFHRIHAYSNRIHRLGCRTGNSE
jgi:hypothetical protein